MVLVQTSFGIACYDDTASIFHKWLAYVQFLPACVVVFNTTVYLIDDDVFFCIISFGALTALYYYNLLLSNALRIARPVEFDHQMCYAPQYALPDATFVSTMCYMFVVGAGFALDKRARRKTGWFFWAFVSGAAILYCVAVVVNRYFLLWQLFANLAIAVLMAIWFLASYWYMWVQIDIGGLTRRKIEHWFGYTDHLLYHHDCPQA